MIFLKEEKREQATFYLSLKKGRAKKQPVLFYALAFLRLVRKRGQGEYQDIRGQESIGFEYTCN